MAHVILGLLLIRPQSLYDLIKNFEAGMALIYSASSGSIKRALDGLLAKGAIEVASIESTGRGRKVYRTTAAGEQEFHSWMTGDIAGPDIEVAILSRMFFVGLLDSTERPRVLKAFQERTATELAQLTAMEQAMETMQIPPEFEDLVTYQRAALDYGLSSTRHALTWLTDLAERDS